MKVRVLPVAEKFRPRRRGVKAPPHNDDWDVEHDFHRWLLNHPHLIDPTEADWDYLPIFWNHYWHRYRQGQSEEIQAEIFRLVNRNRPTFTVCEYDVEEMYGYDLCGTVVATASRRGDRGIDVPLLCRPHAVPAVQPGKKWRASFMGKLETHPVRREMAEKLKGDDIIIRDSQGTGQFVELMLASKVALCPRGHGGQTFRFYEAMQLGVVPYLIGPDTRPFKNRIDWDACSLWAETVDDVDLDVRYWERMGWRAKLVYHEQLKYSQWCPLLLEELDACKA